MDADLLIKNILQLCIRRGVYPTKACEECGVGKSFISTVRKGSVPSVAKIQRLAAYLGVTTSELLGEKENSFDLSDEGLAEITAIFNQLTPENRAKLLELSRMYLSAQRKKKENNPSVSVDVNAQSTSCFEVSIKPMRQE